MASVEGMAAAATEEEAAENAPWNPAAAEDSEEEADEGVAYRHSKRANGKPHTRLLGLFNSKGPPAIYEQFLLKLPEDWDSTTVQARRVTRQVQELQQFIVTRPEKTNNTYWPLEEKLLPIIAEMYDKGLYKPLEIISEEGISIARACLLTSEIATDILQMMLKGSDVLSQIQELAAEGGDGADPGGEDEGMSAAEARTMAGAAAYGSDSYRAGEVVYILSDSLPSDGDSVQPPCRVARGTIRGPAQAGTEECVFYEIGSITLLDEEGFDSQTVWLEDTDKNVILNQTTLQEAFEVYNYLTVPTTNIAAIGSQSGPRLNNLSKSRFNGMRKQELQELCDSLGLDVGGCKVKADYVTKVLEFQEQQSSLEPQASTLDAAAALQAPRLSRFSMKNILNAMTDLQRTQHMLLGTIDPYLNIRGGVRMQSFLGVFKRAAATATRRSMCDRQAGSLAVRPTDVHFMRMCQNWWWQGTVAGLRDKAMFLEQLYTAGRGGDMRELELADRFPHLYPTRPYEAMAILSIQQNGKTNQNGQLMYQGMIRNKDARMCAIAGVGMFSMGMYSIMGLEFPDLLGENRSWYLQPVYPNFKSGGKMNYEEHRFATRRGLDAVDITNSKSTHLPRQAGSQRLIDMGGTRTMAEGHAHWKLEQMDMSYLNGPDINAMALEAGHRNIDSVTQNWSRMQPPVECLEKLFVTKDGLTIQEVIQKLKERNQDRATRLQTPLGVAMYFLEIGTAALQALPMLMFDPDFGSNHPLMNHPAVDCPAFKLYAEQQYKFVTRLESLDRVVTPGSGLQTAVSVLNQQGMLDAILHRARSTAANMTAAATAGGWQSFPAWCAAAASAGNAAAGNAAAGSTGANNATAGSTSAGTAAAANAAAGSTGANNATAGTTAAGNVAASNAAADSTAAGSAAAGNPAAGSAAAGNAAAGNAAAGSPAAGNAAAGSTAAAANTAAGTAAGNAAEEWEAAARAAGWLPPETPASFGPGADPAGLAAEVALMTGVMLSVAEDVEVLKSLVKDSMVQSSSSGVYAQQRGSSQPGSVPDAGQQQQQPQASSSSGGSRSTQSAAATEQKTVYVQFGLTAGIVSTVPRLLHLFEKGWPVAPEGSPLMYQPLTKSKYNRSVKSQTTQWDNLVQGYTLLKRLSETSNISTEQAADVVEAWRLGSAAAYLLADGTVTADAAGATADGSQLFENLLGNTKTLGLDAVVKAARTLELVQQTKNPKRAAAGRAGSAASAAKKRQRRAAAAAATGQ